MKESKNKKVQEYLQEIIMLDSKKFDILQALREIVFYLHPNTTERIMYGGIMFSLKTDFGGIFISKNHISFEFGNGYKFTDPKEILEGTGKFRRHLKIKTFSDIKKKDVEFFLEQI